MEKVKKPNKFGKKVYRYGVELLAVGALTGFFSGLVVTLYSVVATMAEQFARGSYEYIRQHPAWIPLLFVALFLGAVIIGGVVKFIPMIRGSGIPQAEGAARGLLHFKWFRVLTGMFASSLFTIFMGLSAGSEGPSIIIGSACGYGTSTVLRRNESVFRYQVTGGACAGLAVAFNAPLTGMAFSFEEAHKRFTPEVFICAFSSVIVAILTRNVLREAMNLPVESTFSAFTFEGIEAFDLHFLTIVLVSSVVCGLLGVLFYRLIFAVKKQCGKITFWKGIGIFIIPFFLGGAASLLTTYALGGGHAFIDALGSLSDGVVTVFSSPVWVTILLVIVLKFVLTIVNIGVGVPCGAFIPMLSIGAGIGALASLLGVQAGMDAKYCDLLILICMAVFFTTVVKSPITGIVMVMELTWQFTFLLPVILGVAVGYLIGDICRTQPIYDVLLDQLMEEKHKTDPPVKLLAKVRVRIGGPADGHAIRDILWPSNAYVVAIEREGRRIQLGGKTVLRGDDVLTVEASAEDVKEFLHTLSSTAGEILQHEICK